MDTQTLAQAAQAVDPFVQEVRQAIHRHPGTRYSAEENQTLGFIADKVNALAGDAIGRTVSPCFKEGGLVVNVRVDNKLPTRMLRADVDGLAVTEATGLSYASEIEGSMHACGHDAHSAMLLGALKAILAGEITPTCNLRLVWQRAEENPVTESGGAMLVREGVLDGVDTVHGLHVYVDKELGSGTIGLIPGAMLGNSDRFRVVIKSDGGHAARPHLAVNTLLVAAEIMRVFEEAGSQLLDPFEPRSIVPTILKAGQLGEKMSSNVIPGETELWFNARQMLPERERMAFHAELTRRALAVGERFRREGKRLEITAEPVLGHPALFNHPSTTVAVGDRLIAAGLTLSRPTPSLGGEDFAHYLLNCPGAYAFLGCWQEGSGDFHARTFNPDPCQFWRGVHYWLAIATM